MNYAEMMKLFNSRKKGRDFKVFRGPSERITLDKDSGALILSTNCVYWEQDPIDHHYKKAQRPGTPVLRFTPDNVVEILHAPRATSLSDRLMIEKALDGAIYLRSPKFEHRMMLQLTGFDAKNRNDIPLAVGTKIDLNTKKPLSKTEQIKHTTNRTTAQPVYKHVRQVGKVMDILWRMSALDMTTQSRWQTREISADTPTELTEEVLALHAQEAMYAGLNRGNVDTTIWNGSGFTRRSEEEVRADTYAKAREHGLKRLTEFLKLHHGAIVRTVVS